MMRREAPMGHTLAHAALCGVALGILFQVNPLISALVTSLLLAIILAATMGKRLIGMEALLEIVAQIALALALVLFSFLHGFRGDISSYLFGDILAVSNEDLWLLLGLSLVMFLGQGVFYKKWLRMSIQPDLAIVKGDKFALPSLMYYIQIALIVALGMKVVGVMLIGAFLLLPINTAQLWVKNMKQLRVVALLIVLIGSLVGLYASYYNNIPSGAAIVLVLGLLFCGSLVCKRRG